MYKSLYECVIDLENHKQLVRLKEPIDPNLEMSLVHQIIFKQNGPAILYEKVHNTKFPAVSNLFGTYERAKFIFRDSFEKVKKLIEIRANPELVKNNPLSYWQVPFIAWKALPKKVHHPLVFNNKISISDLPLIKNWPKDGGAYITLPIVLSYDVDNPSIFKTNLGMYRIQLTGNRYKLNEEIGLHYQIHRGIGIHHKKAIEKQKPFKVSIFVGGPPAHMIAAVMPLPEGLPEVAFAGALANRRFLYSYIDDYFISSEADFCIIGEVQNFLLPEGPFGDHLGYYSLKHPFPVLKIKNVYCRNNAIWPFTVVGRPPQEDTIFGKMIHELTESMIPVSLPGVKKVHAVDEAGVHPLLLAIGTERYTPYLPKQDQQPMEILTQANAILGFNQLSLAKYLFIVAEEKETPNIYDTKKFIGYLLERIDFERDLHFITNTTIDTLDYSGTKLNIGSKVIFAATYPKKRTLSKKLKVDLKRISISNYEFVDEGILALEIGTYSENKQAIERLIAFIENHYQVFKNIGMIVICDNAKECARTYENFLWITFTRSNPATDIYGPFSFYRDKHWGCKNPIIIDARLKPHHAPPLQIDKKVLSNLERFFRKGNSLEKFEFFDPS